MSHLNKPDLTSASGRQYWRSLDQLADTPEFREWAEREFPAGAAELSPDFQRRDFMKLMSASFLLAGFGLTGCRRPVEKIYPFSEKPAGYTHGVPGHFATGLSSRRSGAALVVESNEGRPTKVEGNSLHPDSNGGTDALTQASILSLYDPDRATRFAARGRDLSKEAAYEALDEAIATASVNRGRGVAFLLEQSASPSRARVIESLKRKLPSAIIAEYEPVNFGNSRLAIEKVMGQKARPQYHLDKASVILSLDADFLGVEEDSPRMIRDFASGRQLESVDDKMSRLYTVEALMTLTGANADHRLRVPSSQIGKVAAQVAARLLVKAGQTSGPLLTALQAMGSVDGVSPAWIDECANDLFAHRRAAVVLAGHRQSPEVHAIAALINEVLEAVGSTVVYRDDVAPELAGIQSVTQAVKAGSVETLVIVGANPVYNAPADLEWAKLIGEVDKVFRLGYYEDETGSLSRYHFPAAHYLESWGDVRTSDGTLVPVQPLIAPLFDGVSELDFLARWLGDGQSAHEIVKKTFASESKDSSENAWKRFLHDGYFKSGARASKRLTVDSASLIAILGDSAEAPSSERLEVVFHRDYSVDDGRYSNNGWLQELPDPVTKITWDNAALMSRQTATELGLSSGDLVELTLDGRALEVPVWIQPGLANATVALALGYGRSNAGRVGGVDGDTVGFNAYALRTSNSAHIASGAKITKIEGRKFEFSCTQDHWSMEGRAIVREGNLEQYHKKTDFAQNMDLEAHASHIPHDEQGRPKGLYSHPYDERDSSRSDVHQWGMAIDLNRCVGCSACVIACQSENNIPIVGKDQVGRGREMHWIRLDRYYAGDLELRKKQKPTSSDDLQPTFEWIDDPQVVTQPMLCQHCESAPCESVCPVNATVHDDEGLNVMAYNRCVGTRYCSNNCPYKVRRFNYFDYNKRPIKKLYLGPLANRSEHEIDLVKLSKNPDVTVRMRGVMEKCTFCVQRIQKAKIAQKIKAGATSDVQVEEGAVVPACGQACPAEAIEFGNLLDPESKVSKLKKNDRNYSVLGFLDTRPRTTYLAKVRNPNPKMPDYQAMPFTLSEYKDHMGDPTVEHHGHHDDHGHHDGDSHEDNHETAEVGGSH